MNLKLIAKSASQLFSLPEICIKLQDLIYDPESSMSDIAQLISVDPSLSARLLKIANSSFYSFPSQIDSLSRAITLIGTADLYSLALATSTPETFGSLEDNEHIDMHRFWRQSVNTGLTSRLLAEELGLRHTEVFFLAGLFHNIGKLVILEQAPDKYLQIKAHPIDDMSPWEIERSVIDYTYADVGDALLACWNMPENLRDMVANQHRPDKAADAKFAAIIHIASRGICQKEYTNDSGFNFIASIQDDAWMNTGLNTDQLEQCLQTADSCVQEMMSNMNLNG